MALRTGSGSGTVRIGNSGELQNITSVDATTAAAIGAGGVGGGLKELGSSTFTTNYGSWELTLPSGYDYHELRGSWPVPANSGFGGILFQFFDGNGGIISSGEYAYGGSIYNSFQADRDDYYGRLTGNYHNNATGSYIWGRMQIWDAYDTSVPTSWRWTCLQVSPSYLGGSAYFVELNGRMLNAEATSSTKFIASNAPSGVLATQTGRTDKVVKYGMNY